MAPTHVFCLFCGNSRERITRFSETTLKKCAEVLKIRKQHKLKYSDVNLPTNVDDNSGYHVKCYRNFTGLMKKYRLSEPSGGSTSAKTSSTEPSTSTYDRLEADHDKDISNEGKPSDMSIEENVQKVCIFCNNKRKIVKQEEQPLYSFRQDATVEGMKSHATQINDINMLQKIENCKQKNLLIFYHNNCKKKYVYKGETALPREKKEWHKKRDNNKIAYEELCAFISDNVIQQNCCYFLTFLNQLYTHRLAMEYNELPESSRNIFSTHHVEHKLLQTFKNKIKIITIHKKKIIKPFQGVFEEHDFRELEKMDVIQRAALILRQENLNIKPNKILEVTVDDLIKRESTTPIVHDFDETL